MCLAVEVIVVDDCSTDSTLAAVSDVIQELDAASKVTVRQIPKNVGVAAALNEGVLL